MVTAAEKTAAFRAAHGPGGNGLVLGNVSTPGLARGLQDLGYAALGTSSAGLADDLGLRDGAPELETLLDNAIAIAAHVELPVSADLENGRAEALDAVADLYRRVAEAGLAGASIEDAITPDGELFPVETARHRLKAALTGARQASPDFVLTARTEVFLSPRPDLGEAIARLRAYEAAGADVLFAPGLPLEALDQVLASISRPLNLLMSPAHASHFSELFSRGIRRISLGAGLTRTGRAAALAAAAQALGDGS